MPAMTIMAGNFFLIGLMGAGKTAVGKRLAQRLGKHFYDSDHEVIGRTGVSINTIFEIEGEASFRDREAAVISELVHIPNIVLATGGGAVLREENCQALVQNGTVIYLRVSVESILQRTLYDKSRPLLRTANKKERLEALYAERDPIYSSIADIVIDANERTIYVLMQKLMQEIFSHHSLCK